MAQHNWRAGIISTGARVAWRRENRGRASGFIEALETRVLLSHSAILNARASVAPFAKPHYVVGRSALSGPAGFTPAEIRKAYQIDQVSFASSGGSVVGDGTGQTIAIVDAFKDPTIGADLHAFDLQFGLPDTTLTVVNQNGGTTLPGTDPSGPGFSWAVETSLDVEWAHSVAPGANIVLVEANSSSFSDLNTAIDEAKNFTGVSVVSMSFGGQESPSNLTDNSLYTTPAGHTNVTFIASAGDSGAFGNGGNVKAVNYPAASPNVVGIGGTTLTTQPDGTYTSEGAWGFGNSSGSFGGGGGGISKYESQPAYQSGIVTQSSTKRTVPDVAFDADPASGVAVYDSFDSPHSPWMVIGGTSLSAPMWAGVMAITNQGRVLSGKATLDGPTETLPALYSLPSADFNDILTGNNGFAAGPGYDLTTGRGTPIVNLVVRDLSGATIAPPPPPTPFIGALTASPTSINAGGILTLTASNVGENGGTVGSVVFYRETNGIGGLQPTSDTLVGVGVSDGGSNWSLETSTAGFSPGSYTYYAVATDTIGASVTATTVVQVAANLAVNDNFANAIPIAGIVSNVTGTNVGATKEFKEPTIAKKPGALPYGSHGPPRRVGRFPSIRPEAALIRCWACIKARSFPSWLLSRAMTMRPILYSRAPHHSPRRREQNTTSRSMAITTLPGTLMLI